MQRPGLASWEATLHDLSKGSTWSSPNSPERLKTAPQPGMQSSSPTFLEAYARFVKEQREADKARRLLPSDSPPPQRAEPRIRALGLEVNVDRSEEPSPDHRRTATGSHVSWPASASTASPKWLGVATGGQSAESLPSPSALAARARLTDASPGRVRRESALRRSTTGASNLQGAVAAAVDALESKCRETGADSQTPSRARTPSPAPRSPWPDVAYEPAAPPASEPGARGSPAVGAGVIEAARGRLPAAGLAAGPSPPRVDDQMEAAFRARPELRNQLIRLLREPAGGGGDDELGLKVQELLRDHPDLVSNLNACFKIWTTGAGGLRQALLSNASVRGWEAGSLAVEVKSEGSVQAPPAVTSPGRGGAAGRGGCWPAFTRLLVPPPDSRHFPWVTVAAIAVAACVFFYMAAGYATFLQQSGGGGSSQPYMPSELLRWLAFSPGWRTFDAAYLLLWGGQYLPAIAAGQGWRWLTAAFLHVTFQHLLGNALLLGVLGGILERRYGAARIFVVLVLATLGAAFFAGAFEDGCTEVVGASGAALGLVGLTFADLTVNWRGLRRGALRLAITAAAVVYFIVTAATKANGFTSNWSHLGGFVCGLFPSFLFLPHFRDERWRAAHRLAAGVKRRALRQRRTVIETTSLDVETPAHGAALPLPLPEARAGELPWVAGRRAPEDFSPAGSEHQPAERLFAEERSDGTRATPRRRWSCARAAARGCAHCDAATLPAVALGALVLVGAYACLPAYIYADRLPRTHCPT